MVIFKSKQNKFEGDLKINYLVKGYVTLVLIKSVKYLGVKIDRKVGNIMVFPLNGIEPMVSFLKH